MVVETIRRYLEISMSLMKYIYILQISFEIEIYLEDFNLAHNLVLTADWKQMSF